MNEDLSFLYHPKHKRVALTPEQLASLISVKQYADKYGYSISGVHYLIASNRVDAYKFGSSWWLWDEAPLE